MPSRGHMRDSKLSTIANPKRSRRWGGSKRAIVMRQEKYWLGLGGQRRLQRKNGLDHLHDARGSLMLAANRSISTAATPPPPRASAALPAPPRERAVPTPSAPPRCRRAPAPPPPAPAATSPPASSSTSPTRPPAAA